MVAKLCWIVHKDLVSECRARRVWPAMLLLGTVVALILCIEMNAVPGEKERLVSGFLWLATFFAGMLALDRSFVSEREEGCWESLRTYPVSASTIYLAKLAVNIVALAALQAVLVPLFAILSDLPLLANPAAILAVALLGNLGISALGTLLGALAAGIRHGANLTALLVLPAAIPIVLAATEATSLTVAGDFGPAWWRWIQLLGISAVLFATAGWVLFDFVIEE